MRFLTSEYLLEKRIDPSGRKFYVETISVMKEGMIWRMTVFRDVSGAYSVWAYRTAPFPSPLC